MNRIDAIFESLREQSKKALMPFFVGGHPAPGMTGDLLRGLERGGASIVEVGLPFSDPVADGPVVASAMHAAIQMGATPEGVLEEIATARDSTQLGIVCMVSASIVQRLGGPARFVSHAVERGVDGFIFPDVTYEESGPYRAACVDAGAVCSLLVAPNSTDRRAAMIAEACTGFVYTLARAGITGEREGLPDIAERVAVLRGATSVPLAVGFGISTADQVRAVVSQADAAIVGSALVRRLSGASEDASAVAELFARDLAQGLSEK